MTYRARDGAQDSDQQQHRRSVVQLHHCGVRGAHRVRGVLCSYASAALGCGRGELEPLPAPVTLSHAPRTSVCPVPTARCCAPNYGKYENRIFKSSQLLQIFLPVLETRKRKKNVRDPRHPAARPLFKPPSRTQHPIENRWR